MSDDVVIGDPRPSGQGGPAGDQRKAGESGPAGDPRPAETPYVVGERGPETLTPGTTAAPAAKPKKATRARKSGGAK